MSLELAKVTKTYSRQSTPAVSDVTIELGAGRITALLGESGSGKTTLLRLIAGFESPSVGSIRYNGEYYAHKSRFRKPQHRSITMIFQDLALFPHLNARQNVLFGMKRIDRAARAPLLASLFTQIRLDGFEEKYPHELSGGQRQRVALARALASRAEIILMDEPFSDLDPRLKWDLIDEIRSILTNVNKTVLFVTHDIDEAFFLADDIAILHQGRLLQHGKIAEVYDRPNGPDVARVFGKINCLPGSYLNRDGIVLVRPDALEVVSMEPESSEPNEGNVTIRNDEATTSSVDQYDGVVAASRFMGVHWETEVRLDTRNSVDGEVSGINGQRLIAQDNRARIVGHRVRIAVPANRLHTILPDDS